MKRFGKMGWMIAVAVAAGLTLPVRGGAFDAWRYRSKIRFAGYTGGAALTNFPALVKLGGLTVANFRYNDFSSGSNADLRFTASDKTTVLDYEIERWDTNGTSTVWVRVPELANTNAFIYAYWGRSGQVAPPCTTNGAVWGVTHLGAWHLDGGGEDATSRGNDGVNYGTTAVNGIAAGGRSFGGSAYIDLPANLRTLGATNAFAITFWFKSASASSGSQCLMEDGTAYTTDSIYLFDLASGNKIQAHLRAGTSVGSDTIAVPAIGTDWHAMAHVYDGATVRTYLDGVQRWSASVSGGIASGNTHLQLGRRPGGTYSFIGVMDELRVERVSRPVDWIRACWLNQGSNTVFQTYGAADLQLGAPEIANRIPVVLDATTSVMNGYLTATGTAATAVSVYWGLTDGGAPTSGLWQATNTWAAGVWGAGDAPALTVSNLTSGRYYYYRFAAENAAGAGWALQSTNFLSGDVWVTGDTAHESGAVPGVFSFCRAATATNEPTVVSFAWTGGSATPNTDFAAITLESLTIPPGATNATVAVNPFFDYFDEEDETVTLNLLPGLYAVGAASNGVVMITDAQVPASTNWSAVSASGLWHDNASWTLGRVPTFGEDVVVTNALRLGASTAYLKSFTLQNATVTLSNWTTRLWSEAVVLQSGALTLPAAFTESQMSNRVWIACSTLTLGAGASIQVNGKGYSGGTAAHTAGYGPGGGNPAYGGGYGGRGGQAYGGIHWGGAAYGSSNAPAQPGSGGGRSKNAGGAGGGVVFIEAEGTVAVYGTISADGLLGVDDDGGGSGGSILIDCLRFEGSTTGLISADGVNGQDTGGGGGGGRIAIRYDEAAQTTRPGVRFTTSYGAGARGEGTGEGGTVFLSGTAVFLSNTLGNNLFTDVRLFVDGWTRWSPDSVTVENSTFVIANAGFVLDITNSLQVKTGGHLGLGVYSQLACGSGLVLTNGGDLSVFAGSTNGGAQICGAQVSVSGDMVLGNGSWVYPWSHQTNGGSVRFTLNNLTVVAGGGFNADQKGFAGGTTAGGYGPGGAPIKSSGAGYGGEGAMHYSLGEIGPAYGSITEPLLPGSGGGGGVGGDGGGLIWIEASGTVAVYGTLTANGGGRTGDRGGGGSGGGIFVDCRRLEGNSGGLISAAGGANADTGGPGGGGRIAVRVDSAAQAGHRPGVRFKTTAGAPTGRTSDTAHNGTVYLSDSSLFRANVLENGLFQDAFVYADNLSFTNWALNSLVADNCRFMFGAEGFRLTVTNGVTVRNGANLGIPGGGILECGSLAIQSAAALSVQGGDTNLTGSYYGSLVDVKGDMSVDGASWVYPRAHPTLGGSPVFRMRNLTITAGGGFNADGAGYSGGLVYGADGYGPGRGLGSGQFGSGGGYGGKGGNETYGGKSGGMPYASTNAPTRPGSGSGSLGGGSGGGLILIEANGNVTMSGTLSANGDAKRAGVSRSGGGSGGGIFVMCRKFSGAPGAVLRANGGTGGTDRAGGGGGGRISVWHGAVPSQFARILAGDRIWVDKDTVLTTYTGTAPSVAYGTGGGQNGVAGTFAFFAAPPQGTWIILR
jgi:hypothetical protein